MKIKNNKIKTARITDLSIGQIVFYKNGYYILSDVGLLVDIQEGTTITYDKDDTAIPVEAELNIL